MSRSTSCMIDEEKASALGVSLSDINTTAVHRLGSVTTSTTSSTVVG
ncbi:MAG: hypothetical protein QM805_04380 [Pseudomonas sp.]